MQTTTNLLNRVGESVGRYRWVICSLLFFATTINYLDRAVIGLLKETLASVMNTDVPVLVHVVTRKGAGYAPAV